MGSAPCPRLNGGLMGTTGCPPCTPRGFLLFVACFFSLCFVPGEQQLLLGAALREVPAERAHLH